MTNRAQSTFTPCIAIVLFSWAMVSLAIAPASGVEIFIVAGQSNALGVAPSGGLPAGLQNQTDVPYWYDYRAGQITSGNAFGTLGSINGLFGPELSLGRTLADALSEDIVIVKVANSGIQLGQRSGEDWNSASTGEAYDDLIANVLAAQANLIAAGETPRIAGFFWHQGESDGSSGSNTGATVPPQPETADAYEANLTNLIASVRNELNVPDLPVFVGELNLGDDPAFPTPGGNFDNQFGQGDFIPTILAAQVAVTNADPLAYLIDTEGFELLPDFVHFNQAGQIDLGEAFAASYLATTLQAADFDGDEDVDGADLAAWQGGFGTTSGATKIIGDADLDGDVDGADFLTWQRQFGLPPPAVAAATQVPEPGSLVLVLSAMLLGCRRSMRSL